MPRGVSKDAENFREVLEKGVILVGGEIVDNNSIDLEDDDLVSVAIIVNVQGYGPHVGAIAATQGGHIDSALQAADEILEDWEMDHNPDYYAELEKEHGDDARDVFTETFDGIMWELTPQEFADAIKGTKAAEFIEVDEPEEEEEGVLEEGDDEDVPLIRISFTRITRGDSDDSDDYEEEHGWIDEEGVEFEPDESDIEDGMTESESIVNQAVDFLKKEGVSEASSTAFHTGVWYSTEYETIDYGTGEAEERSFHLKGFSPEEEAEIFKHVTRRR